MNADTEVFPLMTSSMLRTTGSANTPHMPSQALFQPIMIPAADSCTSFQPMEEATAAAEKQVRRSDGSSCFPRPVQLSHCKRLLL